MNVNKYVKYTVISFIIISVFVGVVYTLIYNTLYYRFHPKINDYHALLDDWSETGLVKHFPKSIPNDAKNCRIAASPRILQGGAYLQVHFQLPPERIKNIYDSAMQKAKQFHDGGSAYTLVNDRNDGLASTLYHTSNTGYYHFPDDYRVFIFEAMPYKPSNWNHGTSRGVVVSLKRNKVIYYAEAW